MQAAAYFCPIRTAAAEGFLFIFILTETIRYLLNLLFLHDLLLEDCYQELSIRSRFCHKVKSLLKTAVQIAH